MPDFALSRRQRGFESRWGHKIKAPLTRSNTLTPLGDICSTRCRTEVGCLTDANTVSRLIQSNAVNLWG